MANRKPALDPYVFCIADLKLEGCRKLQPSYRDFYNGGAMEMITLRENEEAYNRFKIRPRILRNVSNINLSSRIHGQKVALPFGFSPTAMQKLAHPEGEVATSRAAADMGIAMCLSSYANTSLEDVKQVGNGNPYMMQMCVVKDRSITKQLIGRAKESGYRAIWVSVDCPVLGRRLGEMKHNFTLPDDIAFPNILSTGAEEFGSAELKRNGPKAFDDTLEWGEIIPWIKQEAGDIEVWLKGVTTPADLELAIKHGVDGVIVSNHGGRQLDGAPATIDTLADSAPYARRRISIAVDGGSRRGSDIFKALALGAEFCLLGRIPVWGLAYKGQQGVELAVRLLRDELVSTMALAGCASVREITREHLSVLGHNGLLARL